MEPLWYVAKTKPRQEECVASVLSQRNVEVYLPKLAIRETGPNYRSVKRLVPLFPGYVFVRLDTYSNSWLVARSAPGVSRFLGGDGIPTAIPDDLIENIRVRAENQHRYGSRPRFRPGDRVVISNGPLAGLDAIFNETLSASGRSRVLVEILSRLTPVIVASSSLRLRAS